MEKTTDHPHVEEAHLSYALKNIFNYVSSYETILTNLKMANAKLVEQLKVAPAQIKALTDFLWKYICVVTATQSENWNSNKWQRTDKIQVNDNIKTTKKKVVSA